MDLSTANAKYHVNLSNESPLGAENIEIATRVNLLSVIYCQ